MKSRQQRCASILFLVLLTACTRDDPAPITGDFAFVNINVIDVAAGEVKTQRTVVIDQGLITEVGQSEQVQLAAELTRLDGSGQYLLPGLTDMHAHVLFEENLVAYLANGVTTVRNMWGGTASLDMRAALLEGRLHGPRVVTAGGLLDGTPKIWAGSTEVTDVAQAKALVAQQASQGYDFIKVYSRLSPEIFEAILEAARELQMEVSGHVPQDVSMLQAVELGMRTTEHMTGLLKAVLADDSLPNPDLASYDTRAHSLIEDLGSGARAVTDLIDADKVARLAEMLAKRDFWLVPTIDVMKNFTSYRRHKHPDVLRYMTPVDRQIMRMLDDPSFEMVPANLLAGEDVLFRLRADVLLSLHQAGVKILVGTDDSMQSAFVVVDEMMALTEVGLSNADVLRAATIEAANYLGEEGEFGEIRAGGQADLIVVEQNPLDDLAALRAPVGVMQAGRWYPRKELDAMLEAVAVQSATTENNFVDATMLPSGAGTPWDYLHESGAALRIAWQQAADITVITAAIRSEDEWRKFVISVQPDTFLVQEDETVKVRADRLDSGWRLQVGQQPVGDSVKADVSALLTNTPLDILLLEGATGILEQDNTLDIVVWRCGADFDCLDTPAEPLRVLGLGERIIVGHRIFESTNGYSLRGIDAEDSAAIDTWMAPPGLFSGGPARIEWGGSLKGWRRIR